MFFVHHVLTSLLTGPGPGHVLIVEHARLHSLTAGVGAILMLQHASHRSLLLVHIVPYKSVLARQQLCYIVWIAHVSHCSCVLDIVCVVPFAWQTHIRLIIFRVASSTQRVEVVSAAFAAFVRVHVFGDQVRVWIFRCVVHVRHKIFRRKPVLAHRDVVSIQRAVLVTVTWNDCRLVRAQIQPVPVDIVRMTGPRSTIDFVLIRQIHKIIRGSRHAHVIDARSDRIESLDIRKRIRLVEIARELVLQRRRAILLHFGL